MIKPLKYVSEVTPYAPGKPMAELERELGIKESVKLASNENPCGPSPKAIEAIAKNTAELNRYPEGGAYYLSRRLQEKLGVSSDCLIFGNGSNELLDIAVRTFMGPEDNAVMASPSFIVYSMAVRLNGSTPIEVPCVDFRHDLDAMAKAIIPKTKMVFVANPNNPTGTFNTAEEFDRLMEAVPDGVLVVADEAYFEYAEDPSYADSMKHLKAGRDILILRTFSKMYGLAGLRIGYGISQPQILTEMNKVREPFNTNTLAQAAALAAIEDDGHVEKSRKTNAEGKAFLYKELDALGVKYVPSEANFILLIVDDAPALNAKLLKKGVIVRPMGPKFIRVTIGLENENKRFIEAMKEALN